MSPVGSLDENGYVTQDNSAKVGSKEEPEPGGGRFQGQNEV